MVDSCYGSTPKQAAANARDFKSPAVGKINGMSPTGPKTKNSPSKLYGITECSDFEWADSQAI